MPKIEKNYSPKNSLSFLDVQKITTGAGLVLSGAVGAILLDLLTQHLSDVQLTTYGGIIVAGLLSIAVNALRKYRADHP